MPKKTVNLINKQNGNYIIGLKGNQKKLLKTAKSIIEESIKLEELTTSEINKGRIEERTYQLYKFTNKKVSEEWGNLRYIIKVKREVLRGNKVSEEESYYITNKETRLEALSKQIRGHWSIENSLHWVKDMNFSEDTMRFGSLNIPANMSILINIAINILRQHIDKYIRRTMRLCSNKIPLLLSWVA
ncbi:ISAs1 family transposase [Candidatus Dojkabacteria bacterium]|nr:ISAs1 family transposase [Candidatus Dojkabacteria bacterium]